MREAKKKFNPIRAAAETSQWFGCERFLAFSLLFLLLSLLDLCSIAPILLHDFAMEEELTARGHVNAVGRGSSHPRLRGSPEARGRSRSPQGKEHPRLYE